MDLVDVCIDEIALEGLDGITLSALWVRLLSRKTKFPFNLNESGKEYIWSSVVAPQKELEFFELPEPRPPLVVVARFQHLDPDTGIVLEQDNQLDEIYPIHTIKDNPDGIKGSCATFKSRKNVTDIVRNDEEIMDLECVKKRWGESFVIVASQKLRNLALIGSARIELDMTSTVTDSNFVYLERIGRSRHQGEVTIGRANINKTFNVKAGNAFPIRKKLKNEGFITVQQFNMKLFDSGLNAAGRLIFLTRFHSEYRPRYIMWLEQMSDILLRSPMQRDLLTNVRTTMALKEKTFKKVYQLGSKYIKSEVLSYRNVCPNAKESEYMVKSREYERTCRVLRLVTPFKYGMNPDDGGGGDDSDDEYDKEASKDCDEVGIKTAMTNANLKPLLCDRTLINQAYVAIDASAEKGMSSTDLKKRFGICRSDSRCLPRYLKNRSCIVELQVDEGKHRLSKLFSKRNLPKRNLNGMLINSSEKPRTFDSDVSIQLINTFHAKLLMDDVAEKPDENQSICPETSETKEEFDEDLNKFSHIFPPKTFTFKMLRRAEIILNAVKRARIISNPFSLRKHIFAQEDKKVFDRKSLFRIIDRFCKHNLLKKFERTIYIEGQKKQMVFICDVDITEDHPLFLSTLASTSQKVKSSSIRKSTMDTKTREAEEAKGNSVAPTPKYDFNASKTLGYLRRFSRLRVIHQFLWNMVYGEGKLQGELVRPECLAASDWSAFSWEDYRITLPRHDGYPQGWCCIGDVLEALPLALFVKIIRITYKIEGIEEYLEDPIKRMTALKDLAPEIQCQLTYGRRYLFNFHADCQTMTALGLLSFGRVEYVQKEQIFIYVHKNASLVDTTIAANGFGDPPFVFKFDTFKVVLDYWQFFQSFSLNTVFENFVIGKAEKSLPKRFIECLKGKDFSEIVDDGRIPGNGQGVAGIDSHFFAHLRRNWCWNTEDDIKPETVCFDDFSKRNMTGKVKKNWRKGIKRARSPSLNDDEYHDEDDDVEDDSVLCPPPSIKEIQPPKKKVEKMVLKNVVPKKGGMGGKQMRKRARFVKSETDKRSTKSVDVPIEAEDALLQNEVGSATPKSVKRKVRHKDAKDIDAIKTLKKMRVSWTPEEDSLLLLCQLTNMFLFGHGRLFVSCFSIRDIMHENFETSRDKTSIACLRRIKNMMKKSKTVHNVQMYYGEVLQDRDLCAEFKDGKKYALHNMKENEAVFRQCLMKIWSRFRQNDEIQSNFNLPGTLKEIFERFTIYESSLNRVTVFKEPTSVEEIYFGVLYNILHSIAVLGDKTGRSHEIYQLFKMYPQKVLAAVLKSLITGGLLTRNKKFERRLKPRLNMSSLGSYHLTQRYEYKWSTVYSRAVFETTSNMFSLFPPDPVNNNYGSGHLELSDLKENAALCVSLLVKRRVAVETKIPDQIVVLNSSTGDKVDVVETVSVEDGEDKEDKEEEEMIEEAEKEDNAKKNQNANLPAGTPNQTSSRTVLSFYRCQYIHSKSVKLLDVNNSLFVNACKVRIRLSRQEARNFPENLPPSWIYDFYASDKIRDWNHSHLLLHPKTCTSILRSVRNNLPEHVDVEAALTKCKSWPGCRDPDVVDDIHGKIKQSGNFGISAYELRDEFADLERSVFDGIIKVMIALNLLVRVGITGFRYVCLEFSQHWLVQGLKNTKGRGDVSFNWRDSISFENAPTSDSYAEALPSCGTDFISKDTGNVYYYDDDEVSENVLLKLNSCCLIDEGEIKASTDGDKYDTEREMNGSRKTDSNPDGIKLDDGGRAAKRVPAKKSKKQRKDPEESLQEDQPDEDENNLFEDRATQLDALLNRLSCPRKKIASDVCSSSVPKPAVDKDSNKAMDELRLPKRNVSASVNASQLLRTTDDRSENGVMEQDILKGNTKRVIEEPSPHATKKLKVNYEMHGNPERADVFCEEFSRSSCHESNCVEELVIQEKTDGLSEVRNILPQKVSETSETDFPFVPSVSSLLATSLLNSEFLFKTAADDQNGVPEPMNCSENVGPSSDMAENNFAVESHSDVTTFHNFEEFIANSTKVEVCPISIEPRELKIDPEVLSTVQVSETNQLITSDSMYEKSSDFHSTALESMDCSMISVPSSDVQNIRADEQLEMTTFANTLDDFICYSEKTEARQISMEPKELGVVKIETEITAEVQDIVTTPKKRRGRPRKISDGPCSAEIKTPNGSNGSGSQAVKLRTSKMESPRAGKDFSVSTESPSHTIKMSTMGNSTTVIVVSQGDGIPTQSHTALDSNMAGSVSWPASAGCAGYANPPPCQTVSQLNNPRPSFLQMLNPSDFSHPALPQMITSNSAGTGFQAPGVRTSLKIQVPASSLGDMTNPALLAQNIQEILARNGSIAPGSGIRIRLPPGIPGPRPGLPPRGIPSTSTFIRSSPPIRVRRRNTALPMVIPKEDVKRTVSDQDRILQLDGAADDKPEAENHLSSIDSHLDNPQHPGVVLNSGSCENLGQSIESPSTNQPGTSCDSLPPSEALSNTALDIGIGVDSTGSHSDGDPLKDEIEANPDELDAKSASSSSCRRSTRVRKPSSSEPEHDDEAVPPQKGTYKTIRIVPRPWQTPEGTVNRQTLRTMLESVLSYVMERPGLTRQTIFAKYHPLLQPVAVLELIEFLEKIGCLTRSYLKMASRPSLFSSRAKINTVTEDRGTEIEIFEPTSDCIIKLGQFVSQIPAHRKPAHTTD